jgi:uncharacterized protein YbjQ (UPF0145 family)
MPDIACLTRIRGGRPVAARGDRPRAGGRRQLRSQAREVGVSEQWDGRGLPPAAAARMARFSPSTPRTSLLSAPAAYGIASVGLEPVGEVMGCIVEHIGWRGFGGCGVYQYGSPWGGGYASPPVTSGRGYAGYRPYVDALYRGYETAIERMVQEATAMGSDGVVGVRLTVNRHEGDNSEFVALGTAVRAPSSTHRPDRPFTTELPGQDVAKLLQAGWVPVGIALGISVAIRHDDINTRYQASWQAGNAEVSGYTELVNHTRADARTQLEKGIRARHADGAIVSDMDLRMWSIEPTEQHRDHVAQATIRGTAIAKFHDERWTTRSLGVLPLR